MRKTAAPVLLGLVLTAGLVGCGGDPGDDLTPTGASEPPASGTPTAAPAEPTETSPALPDPSEPPFTADTRPDDGGYGSGNGLGLSGVRVSRHEGYDRVVFDLAGTGTPGWRVEYVDRPRADGSGEPVPLEGTVFLQVFMRGFGLPFDTGIEPFGDGTTRISGTGTEGVTEIAPGGVFEGDHQAFIGLTGDRRPFRAFALTDPARLVVDVQHG